MMFAAAKTEVALDAGCKKGVLWGVEERLFTSHGRGESRR